jgi:hypothetical protein
VSLELGYTAGLVKVSIHPLQDDETELAPSRNGMVHTFALRPRVQLGRFGVASAGHAVSGPVLVWRTGQGFAPYDGSLRGGWSVGLGATLRAGRLLFRGDLEDVIYPLALSQPGVLDTHRTVRLDLLLTVGLPVPCGRLRIGRSSSGYPDETACRSPVDPSSRSPAPPRSCLRVCDRPAEGDTSGVVLPADVRKRLSRSSRRLLFTHRTVHSHLRLISR